MPIDTPNSRIEQSDTDRLFAYLEKYGDHAPESDIVSMMLNEETIPKDRIRGFLSVSEETLFQLGDEYKKTHELLRAILVRYIQGGGFETDEQRDERVLEAYTDMVTRTLIDRVSASARSAVEKK